MSLDETTEALPPAARRRAATPKARPALVLAWSASEPHRVGEVIALEDDRPVEVGRAGPGLRQQRPGETPDTGPLTARGISRRHLRLQALSEQRLQVELLGRAALHVDGRPTAQAVVAPESQILIEGEALFWVTTRPPRFVPLSAGEWPPFPFAGPDAGGLVGESPAAWTLRDRVAFVGPRAGHVLVLGPSGAGKELVARALHRLSDRPQGPFVARNAATLPESLVDAELFGHARNYPQAGMPERPGLVGEADGGTLFLDEIGELPQPLQAHLLRLMDGGEYRRLGEAGARRAELRIVAATNRPREALKHDLLARFRHVIEVPPLVERRADIPLLLRHLLRQAAAEDPLLARRFLDDAGEPRFAAALVSALLRHPLPLQVRELDNLLWRCLGASPDDTVQPTADLLDAGAPVDEGRDPATITRTELEAALAEHEGVQAKVWPALGLQSRYQLRRLLRKYGLG
ncbi:MAG: sigma-54-dependent Fis family transcriptional regulator [Myxococcales bacterium]|nr:sigma-54-dependent Fis family transcriptional regulator [Myxococcales bacterium]